MNLTEQEYAFRREVLERLAGLEQSLKPLVGNGQPGAIANLFKRVRDLEDAHNRMLGIGAILTTIAIGFGAVLDTLIRRLLG